MQRIGKKKRDGWQSSSVNACRHQIKPQCQFSIVSSFWPHEKGEMILRKTSYLTSYHKIRAKQNGYTAYSADTYVSCHRKVRQRIDIDVTRNHHLAGVLRAVARQSATPVDADTTTNSDATEGDANQFGVGIPADVDTV